MSPPRHKKKRGSPGGRTQGRRYWDEGEIHENDHEYPHVSPQGRPWGEDDYSRMYEDDGAQPDRHRSQGRYQNDRCRYRDYDDPRRANRSHSRSRSPARDAGQPSDTVIVEGLPSGIPLEDIQASILSYSPVADFRNVDVRITSRGNIRAFVQFDSVDDAIALMQSNFPMLPIELPRPTDNAPDGRFRAFMHYARPRDEGDNQGWDMGSWDCRTCDCSNYSSRTVCRQCGAAAADESNWRENLTGATDIGDSPSQILVVYPLSELVTEEMLADEMKRLEVEKPGPPKDSGNGAPKLKSTAPTENAAGYGARIGSLHRVLLMREISSDASFKFGFVEFWTLEDAAAAVKKFSMLKSFTVAASPANVSSIHMGVFLPEERSSDTAGIERTSFHPLLNPTLRVRYWDRHLYPSQFVVTADAPESKPEAKPAGEAATDSKKTKKRKAEGSLGTPVSKKAVPLLGQMAKWQRKHDELHASKGKTQDNQTPASDTNQTPLGPSPGKRAGKQGQTTPIKFNLPASSSLTSLTSLDSINSPDKRSSPEKEGEASSGNDGEVAPKTELPSFVNLERLMCLICMLKYKSAEDLSKHEKSSNHRSATKDSEKVKAALARLAKIQPKSGNQNASDGASTATAPQYRDRAKERREAYNQPNKPSGQASAGGNGTSQPKPSPVKEEKAPAQPQQSKGAGMLAKMGWATGAGLGANGEGRTEIITTNAYQEGVGLGAEGSNLGDAAQLAERKTKNNYSDYLNTVQEKARERYSKMD